MNIDVELSASGIDKAIAQIAAYEERLKRKTESYCDRLVDLGSVRAQDNFSSALYAGTNDVVVDKQPAQIVGGSAKATGRIEAEGSAVLFIEFGSGVTYPDNHPDQNLVPYGRGEYGKGQGKNSHWFYKGDAGNLGEPAGGKLGERGLIYTKGNPANMCMYDAEQYIESIAKVVAKEEFR